MKILIGKNIFDKTICYQKWFNGEIPNETKIVEIEEQYQDCAFEDFDKDFNFSIEQYNLRKQKENAELKIAELKTLLAGYDYIGVKIATGRATKEEYSDEIKQMNEWANEINELEEKYKINT